MILELYLELSYLLSQILFLPSVEPKVYESLFWFSAAAASHFVEIDICRTLIPLVLGFHGCLDFMDFWTSWNRLLDLMDFWSSWIFGLDGLMDFTDFWISKIF